MRRRSFLARCAAGVLLPAEGAFSQTLQPRSPKPPPSAALERFIAPGHDSFPEEVRAAETANTVREWWAAQGGKGNARFYVLPDDVVRFEIKNPGSYRTGFWKLHRTAGKLQRITTIEEETAHTERTLFRDVTGAMFENVSSFADQLCRGAAYWSARLDPATGIDIYGNNGVAVGDIDNDGIDEVYVCQSGGLPNRLYKNVQGRFEDISESSGVNILDHTASALFLDLRNTGRQDLVILGAAGPALFLNDGMGKFRFQPGAFRFANPPAGNFTGMAAADFDLDGKLDLYLCSYLFFQNEAQYRYPVPYHDARNGPPNFLFHNQLDADGNGGFVDVTKSSGMDHNNDRFSFAAAWCDYDRDGRPELYVANDFGRNNLYRFASGKFHDVADQAGVEDLGPGMSASWFDYDGDGRPDLYVSNMWSAAGQRVSNSTAFGPAQSSTTRKAYSRHMNGNSLFRNLGNGAFEDVGDQQRVPFGRWAWSSDGHDFDCDGRPEIFITCGMLTNDREPDLESFFWRQVVANSPSESKPVSAYEDGWNAINQFVRQGYSWNGHEPNVFYAPHAGQYVDYSGVSGLDVAEDGRAFAVTDLTGDGTLDLILKSRLGPQVRVFENQCAANRNRVVIRLHGERSNRDAIGARVEVDGAAKWVSAGSGYLSQHTKSLHFGTAEKTTVKMVKVTWPSGLEQTFGPLKTGFRYDLKEADSVISFSPLTRRVAFKKDIPEVTGDNIPRLHSTWFVEPIPLPDRRPGPGLLKITNRESAAAIATYSVFRRYLFEWRADLELPLFLLLDPLGRATKIYDREPPRDMIAEDLRSAASPLLFGGRYLVPPRRDFYKIGAALLSSGSPEQALPYLELVLKRTPQDAKVLVLVGQIHLAAGRLRNARDSLARVLRADRTNAEALNAMGGVEAAGGDSLAALRYYEEAVESRPGFIQAIMNVAGVCADLNRQSEAQRYYQQVLQIAPENPDAENGLGLALANQGSVSDAKAAFERAIALRRDFGAAINNLGVVYISQGDRSNAIAAFQYGIAVTPDDTLYRNLFNLYLDSGSRDKAEELVRQWSKTSPSNEAARKALDDLNRN